MVAPKKHPKYTKMKPCESGWRHVVPEPGNQSPQSVSVTDHVHLGGEKTASSGHTINNTVVHRAKLFMISKLNILTFV